MGSQYLWLRHLGRLSQEQGRDFKDLRESDLKTARAWALKGTAMRLFDFRRAAVARKFFPPLV